MYKNVIRVVPRPVLPTRSLLTSSRRFLSTAPPAKQRRSWKSSAARWSVAAGIIYFYNTSDIFAEEPEGESLQLSHGRMLSL
jgi:intermembrane space import and assembly protein 40